MGPNVYITSQYFFPAIIYRDIISHITITYRYIMYFFRTFKKSTAPYKVHNMGLRYIKKVSGFPVSSRDFTYQVSDIPAGDGKIFFYSVSDIPQIAIIVVNICSIQ